MRRGSTGLYWTCSVTAAPSTWPPATGTASWSLPFAATAFPADETYLLSARATYSTGTMSTPTTTVTIDRTDLGAGSLASINRVAIVGRIETADQPTPTFTEAIAASSLIAG